jgi:hypothetical protein
MKGMSETKNLPYPLFTKEGNTKPSYTKEGNNGWMLK